MGCARNSTLSISGAFPSSLFHENDSILLQMKKREDFWREKFTVLDGPEIFKTTIYDSEIKPTSESSSEGIGIEDYYDRLVEYMQEWGKLLAEKSETGLTTPVRADIHGRLDSSSMITPATSRTILYQEGVRLLFLPTNTGARYLNREEEAQQENDQKVGGGKSTKFSGATKTREGGVEILVEITRKFDKPEQQQLRVRARRTNYADDAVVKELSETTILKRLQDALKVWKKDRIVL